MELEITPEPSEEERSAIVEALQLELQDSDEPSAWQRLALQPAEEDDEEV